MKHNLLKSVIISVILLMGVSNAWAGAGFHGVYLTYSHNGTEKNYNFTDNTKTVEIKLGTLTADFTLTGIYLKYWKDNSGNMCGGLMDYYIDSDQEYQPSWTWYYSGSGNDRELQSTAPFIVAKHNGNSGHYTFWYRFKTWGSTSSSSDCNQNFYFPSNSSNKNSFTYTIAPPAVSSINISASGHLAGSGAKDDPYILVYGESLKLTANVSNSDANSDTHFTFGSNATSTTKTHTISNITSATAQKLTIKAQNINKSDNRLKGTELSKDVYYKYTPVYVYINGQNHQINNTTKQVTVALNRNANDETYTFKVHDDNNHWLGNSGTMERGGTSVHSGGWTMSVDDQNDCKLKADLTGDYTFTFIPAGNKVTVTYPQKSYFIAGSWDNWAGTAPSFVDASTPVSIYLEADQTYSFKVADLTANAKWYGNDGTMVRGTSTGWTMSTSEGDCKITADYTGDYTFTFDVSTKKLTVRYPILITLGYCEFGTYGIKHNGQSYFSKPNENVKINVPYDAEITLIEGTPHSSAYKPGVIQAKPEKQLIANPTEPITILNDVTYDDNFVTKETHVVYLGVPDNLTDWKEANYNNFIWTWDTYTDYGLVASTRNFTIGNVTYYEFTIPAERHSFCFQRKTSVEDKGTPQRKSIYLPYQIPLTNINCFTLNGEKDSKSRYKGDWGTLPTREGDYRLLYVEQVVEKDADGNTVITRKKAHPSDVVKAGTASQIVSLHLYKDRKYDAYYDYTNELTYPSSSNPEIILQKYDGEKWVDKEWHMVYGPLETLPMMACLPGRKNASPGSDIDDLKYHDGIEVIKNDILTHEYKGNGVWNFLITQDNSGEATLHLDAENLKRYDGQYYIRTDVADGGWNNYTATNNHMGYSEISMDHSNYSHYYCKWISNAGTNVKYTIANDYGMAISDTLEADITDIWGQELADEQKIVRDQTLPAKANVRFSWNEESNFLHRAYLAGSGEIGNRFLVVEGEDSKILNADGQPLVAAEYNKENPRSNLLKNEEIFNDISNWVYYADVQLVPNAGLKVTAKYNEKVQYFVGQADQYNNTILAGTGSQKYLIRLLYDFKTNHLLSAYVPGGNTTIEEIQADLMLIRRGNGEASQLAFNTKSMNETGKTAYGVMEFPYEILNDGSKPLLERCLYWVSFPFDVYLPDAFGTGEYGVHWLIQEYDGASRAEKGLWAESDTYWKLHWNQDITLEAGKGYVLELDIDGINKDYEATFNKEGHTIAIYFPSKEPIKTEIVKHADDVIINVPAHQCTIPIRETPYGNRQLRDSHWNVIGVPSYVNAGAKFDQSVIPLANELKFYYKWNGVFDSYTPMAADEVADELHKSNFWSMHSYMVQYAGDLKWSNVVDEGPAQLAARKTSDTQQEHKLHLELQQNGESLDRTFVTLQEDDVTTAFDFNYDLCKITNKGANIYSLIPTENYPIQVAGNVLPINETVIPLGVVISAAGEYTFAMPDGTDGIVVELIDYETNTRTNMLLDEYTVNLGKGTFENRFALHVKPNKTVTSIESITTPSDSEVRKFIIDGVLYMQKDGVLYDAQGRCVR